MTKSLSSEPSMDDILASIRRSVNGGDPAPEIAPPPVKQPIDRAALTEPEPPDIAQSVLREVLARIEQGGDLALSSRGPSLEDLVRAELRPLLSAWLDRNLPGLVTAQVRQVLQDLVGSAAR